MGSYSSITTVVAIGFRPSQRCFGHFHSRVGIRIRCLRTEAVIVPGGFSFGDYLRCGAIAHSTDYARSEEFEKKAAKFEICNGFQILYESGLLPKL